MDRTRNITILIFPSLLENGQNQKHHDTYISLTIAEWTEPETSQYLRFLHCQRMDRTRNITILMFPSLSENGQNQKHHDTYVSFTVREWTEPETSRYLCFLHCWRMDRTRNIMILSFPSLSQKEENQNHHDTYISLTRAEGRESETPRYLHFPHYRRRERIRIITILSFPSLGQKGENQKYHDTFISLTIAEEIESETSRYLHFPHCRRTWGATWLVPCWSTTPEC